MRIALRCADPGVPLGGPKGCSVHLRAVAAALLRAGHEVEALVARPGDAADVGALEARGLGVHAVPADEPADALARRLGELRPQLVIERLALLAPQGAEAAARLDVPHLYEVNAPLDLEAAAHRGFTALDEARAAFRAGFAASRGAVAVSQEVHAWIGSLAPEGYPVRVVPNGAGPEFFAAPDPARVARLRLELGLESGGLVVGFVGSFRPWHDLAGLVAAVGRLPESLDARLLMVGDGPLRNEVLRRACEAGARLVLAGRVRHEDVPAHLALCDVVAVPYADEAAYFSPLKLAEALAAGRPVVASATRSVQRVVVHEFSGLLVPPGEPVALAAAIARLAANPELRERVRRGARRVAEARYSWDAVVEDVLSFAYGRLGLTGGAVA